VAIRIDDVNTARHARIEGMNGSQDFDWPLDVSDRRA
jgi:hypothetical protein